MKGLGCYLLLCLIVLSKAVTLNKGGFLLAGNYSCNDGRLLNLEQSWYYNLSPHPDPLNKCPPNTKIAKEFVPMIYDCGKPTNGEYSCEDQLPKNYAKLWSAHGAKYLMAFYKPDSENGSNISARTAALLWPQIEQIAEKASLQVVSPFVSSSNFVGSSSPWLDDFFDHCAIIKGCNPENIKDIVYEYISDSPTDLNPSATELSGWYGSRQIWFASYSMLLDANRTEIDEYARISLATLDGTDLVSRYAWYGSRNLDGDQSYQGDLLIDGGLTSTGEIYSRLGDFVIANVFSAQQYGHAAFRIPGVLKVPTEDGLPILLAYAEGRIFGCYDFAGQHNVVVKRSTDFGKTWDDTLIEVANPWVQNNTYGCNFEYSKSFGCEFWDPTAVYDEVTKEIFLFAAYTDSTDANVRVHQGGLIYMWKSKDFGLTWSKPYNLTKEVQGIDRQFVGTPANGHGIQLKYSSKKGRLLIPFYNPFNESLYTRGSYVIYSDDHGESWKRGEGFDFTSSEGDITEMKDGSLYYAVRSDNEQMDACGDYLHCRGFGVSHDGGETWAYSGYLPELPDPCTHTGGCGCKAGVDTAFPSGEIFFVNNFADVYRVNLTLSRSFDGLDWNQHRVIYKGTAGYTDLAVWEVDGAKHVGIIFEAEQCSVWFATLKVT